MDNNFLRRRTSKYETRRTDAHQSVVRPSQFQTPEAVAEQEDTTPNERGNGESGASPVSTGASTPNPKHRRSFKEWLKGVTRQQWIIIGIVAVLVLGGGGFALYHFVLKKTPKPAPVVHKQVTPKPAPAPQPVSMLTGLPISDPSVNQRPVTAVMIENSGDARPQSGLSQAGVVFEAVAEGGITRFLTLFQDTEPTYLGPVRSVRPYYIQWLMGFDAAVAHVGGSGEALGMLKSLGVKDLDQFYNPGPYQRITSRVAPHNVYTSVTALRELQQSKGYTSTYTGFARKPEAKAAASTAGSIDFAVSGAFYNPHYDYDAATNTYKRFEGGSPQIDQNTNQQLAPKVVIALVMPQGSNGIYTTYNTIGSGEADVFQDGLITKGTWHKSDNKSQFTFTDANGAPLKLDPGQTWLSVVGSADRISYK